MINSLVPYLTIDFPTVGGASGILVAIGWSVREMIQWLNRRKDLELAEVGQHVTATSSAVNDAATVNAVMLRNIEALQAENQRVHSINTSLVQTITEKDRTISEMQNQIQKLMGELDTLYGRLEELKSR
jgi:predicted DNA-binding protein YlxM (UPF0122 family)